VVGEPIDFFFEKNTIHLISVAYNLEFLDWYISKSIIVFHSVKDIPKIIDGV
jgi:hypothetical protein